MLLPGHRELNPGAGNGGLTACIKYSSDDSQNDRHESFSKGARAAGSTLRLLLANRRASDLLLR